MKVEEIKHLSDEELTAELQRLHRHLFDLRAQAVTEKLENPSMLGKAKRDIARVLTVQHERLAELNRQASPGVSKQSDEQSVPSGKEA